MAKRRIFFGLLKGRMGCKLQMYSVVVTVLPLSAERNLMLTDSDVDSGR